jgi:hypothetical protein
MTAPLHWDNRSDWTLAPRAAWEGRRARMPVLWKGRPGIFRRDVGDGEHAEVVIDGRVYRVCLSELA